ncbi:MAG: DUF2804 domain-containing protein [Polyangiales bacterium]
MTASDPLPNAPASFLVDDDWQVGVYRTPFARAELSRRGWQRLRLKEWHYISLTTDEWFVAVGLVNLGYVGNLFSYAVDRVQGRPAVEYGALSPLGRALSIAASSVDGTTSWKSRDATVSVAAKGGWNLELDIPLGSERLRGSARIEARESLAMLHRLGPGRLAYTHKAAGWPASGQLELGARSIRLDGGLAASDWTRSQANRVTEWKWASMSGFLRDGTAIGLNLSAEVYDDQNGHSVENAVWLNGEVRRLSGVHFEMPSDPKTMRWLIGSLGSDEVEIEFEPLGAREEHTNFGLVRTDFVQPYGRFEGRVCGHEVAGCFGVVETHLSVW